MVKAIMFSEQCSILFHCFFLDEHVFPSLKRNEKLLFIPFHFSFFPFLVGAFEEKCSTLTVGSFFIRVRSFFCSFVQQIQLRRFKTLETSEPCPKQQKQNRPPEPRKHTNDRPLAILVFFT